MLLQEPSPTQADLHFKLLGFPVRVHPYFWLVAVLMGLNSRGGTPPVQLVLWIITLFASILIHELGHALLQRHFGGQPWITLYGMGGLASSRGCDPRTKSQVLIALAGPVAGFLFAGVVVLMVILAGNSIGYLPLGRTLTLEEITAMGASLQMSTPLGTIYWYPFDSENVNFLIQQLLWVNILSCVAPRI